MIFYESLIYLYEDISKFNKYYPDINLIIKNLNKFFNKKKINRK
jgi:hypothetical protein